MRGLQKGIEEFNTALYFESHDTLEAVWLDYRGPDRQFFQGLIQIAVGLYHLSRENSVGARSQLCKGTEKLKMFRPRHRRVRVDPLLSKVQAILEAGDNDLAAGPSPGSPLLLPIIEHDLGTQ